MDLLQLSLYDFLSPDAQLLELLAHVGISEVGAIHDLPNAQTMSRHRHQCAGVYAETKVEAICHQLGVLRYSPTGVPLAEYRGRVAPLTEASTRQSFSSASKRSISATAFAQVGLSK